MWLGIAVIIGLILGVCLLYYVMYRLRGRTLTLINGPFIGLILVWMFGFALCLAGAFIILFNGLDAYVEDWVFPNLVRFGYLTAIFIVCYPIIVIWLIVLKKLKKKELGVKKALGSDEPHLNEED